MKFEECRKKVDYALDEFLKELPRIELNEPIRFALKSGGKRMRPAMAIMACEMFSGDISACIRPALAIELFHNFTLLHDDVMDNAPSRRGRPTVHAKWNASAAILSGDAMLVHAYKLMASLPQHLIAEVLPVFNECAIAVCEGQQLDMEFEKQQEVEESEYIAMVSQKTSALLGAALQIGAIVGGASKSDQQHLYDAGVNMGIAFQLMDDYLDVFGNENLVGKKRGGDIVSGKKTILLIRALKTAGGNDKAELLQLLEKSANPERKVNGITALFEKLGVHHLAESMMTEYHEKAVGHLARVSAGDAKKEPLLLLANQLLFREN